MRSDFVEFGERTNKLLYWCFFRNCHSIWLLRHTFLILNRLIVLLSWCELYGVDLGIIQFFFQLFRGHGNSGHGSRSFGSILAEQILLTTFPDFPVFSVHISCDSDAHWIAVNPIFDDFDTRPTLKHSIACRGELLVSPVSVTTLIYKERKQDQRLVNSFPSQIISRTSDRAWRRPRRHE